MDAHGFNQEDSMLINSGSVRDGIFRKKPYHGNQSIAECRNKYSKHHDKIRKFTQEDVGKKVIKIDIKARVGGSGGHDLNYTYIEYTLLSVQEDDHDGPFDGEFVVENIHGVRHIINGIDLYGWALYDDVKDS